VPVRNFAFITRENRHKKQQIAFSQQAGKMGLQMSPFERIFINDETC